MDYTLHYAQFDYNYVFRALWGEKYCETPLQDIDPPACVHPKTFEFRTVSPEHNNPGYIALTASELAAVAAFVHHYDPEFMQSHNYEYIQNDKDSFGCISARALRFADDTFDCGCVDLIHGMLIKTKNEESWEAAMRWNSVWSFYEFIDAVMAINKRWNELLDKHHTKAFKDAWYKTNQLFRRNGHKLQSAIRIATLRSYRETVNMIIDIHIGNSDIKIDKLADQIRMECVGPETAPIRELFGEVRALIKDKEAEIL